MQISWKTWCLFRQDHIISRPWTIILHHDPKSWRLCPYLGQYREDIHVKWKLSSQPRVPRSFTQSQPTLTRTSWINHSYHVCMVSCKASLELIFTKSCFSTDETRIIKGMMTLGSSCLSLKNISWGKIAPTAFAVPHEDTLRSLCSCDHSNPDPLSSYYTRSSLWRINNPRCHCWVLLGRVRPKKIVKCGQTQSTDFIDDISVHVDHS